MTYTMTETQAQFAAFFTAPEGVTELDYCRAAQDALDTAKTGALQAYGQLQTRIAAAL